MLDSVGKALTKSITLQLALGQISDDFVNKINTVIKNSKGKHKLSLEVFDVEDEMSIQLVSPDRKVNADSVFIDELQRLGIKYKLN